MGLKSDRMSDAGYWMLDGGLMPFQLHRHYQQKRYNNTGTPCSAPYSLLITHYAAYLLQLRPDRRRGRHCMQHTLVKRYRLLLKSQSCVDIRQAIQQLRVRLIAKRIQ